MLFNTGTSFRLILSNRAIRVLKQYVYGGRWLPPRDLLRGIEMPTLSIGGEEGDLRVVVAMAKPAPVHYQSYTKPISWYSPNAE